MLAKNVIVARYDSYDSVGDYPEDDWILKQDVEDVRDLYDFFKKIHKLSASTVIDYPLGGKLQIENLSFFEYKWLEYDGEIYKTELKQTNTPEFYSDALKKYNKLIEYMEKRLPKIRKIRKERINKEKELKELENLKEKYKKEG